MYDVAIVGSGVVGLVAALLLAKDSALRIVLVDARPPDSVWSKSAYDPRVYAITPASRQILETIKVWPDILAKRASLFTRMQVWDSQGKGELSFDQSELKVPALGFIVEENLLRSTLFEKLAEYSQIDLLCPVTLTGIQEEEAFLELGFLSREPGLNQNNTLRARLLVGADGAESWVREKAGLHLLMKDYHHTALIAQVETEEPHQRTARQVFLTGGPFPKGPLAFLPLLDAHHCSIVWSTTPEEAAWLLKLEESAVQEVLAEAFAFRLGKVLAVAKRQAFSLYERHAENYVKNRLALIGDAVHTLHPLAGQGLNLGMADAASLAEVILEAFKKGRDFASVNTLRRYERARKGNNLIMLSAVKLLKNLFTSENRSLCLLRNQGLNATDHFSPLKNFFARYAMGF